MSDIDDLKYFTTKLMTGLRIPVEMLMSVPDMVFRVETTVKLGYKGKTEIDSASYYCPYVPVHATVYRVRVETTAKP